MCVCWTKDRRIDTEKEHRHVRLVVHRASTNLVLSRMYPHSRKSRQVRRKNLLAKRDRRPMPLLSFLLFSSSISLDLNLPLSLFESLEFSFRTYRSFPVPIELSHSNTSSQSPFEFWKRQRFLFARITYECVQFYRNLQTKTPRFSSLCNYDP